VALKLELTLIPENALECIIGEIAMESKYTDFKLHYKNLMCK